MHIRRAALAARFYIRAGIVVDSAVWSGSSAQGLSVSGYFVEPTSFIYWYLCMCMMFFKSRSWLIRRLDNGVLMMRLDKQ